MEKFNPKKFVDKQVGFIKKTVGSERALVAVSGGVDSVTSAALTYRAVGKNLLCVMLDDAFMREGEPEQVAKLLSQPPLNMSVQVLNVKQRFLDALKGLRDAEEKRKVFRENFYQVLKETAEKEGCQFLVQGTIQADIVETKGGVKTQHNVLEQIGIRTKRRYGFQVVEPLAPLYKEQVRRVARHLGIPAKISERQPFPGPGLSVRAVGEIRTDKLKALKKATVVVEENFAQHKPSQYFAAIIDDEEMLGHRRLPQIQQNIAKFLDVPSRHVSVKVFRDKATGVRENKRCYGEVVAVQAQTVDEQIHQPTLQKLVSLQNEIIMQNPSVAHVWYMIKRAPRKQLYVIVMRAIQTRDFLTAQVAEIPWSTLKQTAQRILESCSNVSSVYYDVTPKPPATIEME
ncbi:MAG: ATP-binding protein [Thermoproteota archaeon]|nr:ATP-binding protein [Thermoproteota archaeon]